MNSQKQTNRNINKPNFLLGPEIVNMYLFWTDNHLVKFLAKTSKFWSASSSFLKLLFCFLLVSVLVRIHGNEILMPLLVNWHFSFAFFQKIWWPSWFFGDLKFHKQGSFVIHQAKLSWTLLVEGVEFFSSLIIYFPPLFPFHFSETPGIQIFKCFIFWKFHI